MQISAASYMVDTRQGSKMKLVRDSRVGIHCDLGTDSNLSSWVYKLYFFIEVGVFYVTE
jgi:hypothetical protein